MVKPEGGKCLEELGREWREILKYILQIQRYRTGEHGFD